MANKFVRPKRIGFCTLLILATTHGCTTERHALMTSASETNLRVESHPHYHQDHHHEDGYRNIWESPRTASFWRSATWIVGRAFNSKENIPAPEAEVDLDALSKPAATPRFTWIGHASFLLQIGDRNILLDPTFSDRASPLSFAGPKREAPLPLEAESLPSVDLVIISHDHYDHLDRGSVQDLERLFQPLFLVPLGVGKIARDFGATRVLELDWWQYIELDGLRLHNLPAKHFSGRGLFNRGGTLWSSWYIEDLEEGHRIYFAGDSGYASHFQEVRETLGPPDIVLMPIGAYRPRWFMQSVHVDPGEALQAVRDLEARQFIPMHWGTFDLADEAIQEPIQVTEALAEERGMIDQMVRLKLGESFELQTD